jgi:hypothetical protein
VVRELGTDGISYAIASEVLNQDAVRPLPMHETLPDDPRYPYSQPRNYIYRGEPSLPVEAFLGFATNAEGQTAVAQAQQTASANVTVGASKLPGGVTLAPDGSFMVRGTEDGQLQWLDAQGNPTATAIADAHRGAVSAVVISPDGQTVVSSGADGTLRRWDRNGTPLGEPMVGQGGPILALALSPDGQILASGSANGSVERWNLADGAAVGTPIAAHSGPVQAIHFPAGGQGFITGSSDGSLGFWNPDGTAAGQAENAHGGGVTAITSSPDGQVLTTTGADGTLRQWDRSTLQPRGEAIQAHGDAVSAVAYSPDGSTLATAGADSTLQLWGGDGAPRLPEAITLEEPAASLGYTPEGELVVGTSDRTVERRDGQGQPLDGAAPSGSATELGGFWARLQNLPPSAWWMLAAIPALLLLAGIVGAMMGGKSREEDEADLALEDEGSPNFDVDFSGVGKQPPATGEVPPADPQPFPDGGVGLPPEAGLVPPEAEYPSPPGPSKLEQARIDLAEGKRLMREGRYDSALIYFNNAVEATEVERLRASAEGIPAQGINAIAAQAQAQRGNALALLGQANEAMDSYNAALQLDASMTDGWIGKGRLLSTMGRYEEAIFCFESALERDPAAGEAWLGKGEALLQLGRQTEAQASLEQASRLGLSVPGLTVPASPSPYPEGTGYSGVTITPGPIPEADLLGADQDAYAAVPGPAYDPDVPLELQQMVQGLPSADVEIAGVTAPSAYDVPPVLAAEAAQLPSQAETAAGAGGNGWAGTAGGITPGPIPPEVIAPLPGTSLEEELLNQVSLGTAADLLPLSPTPVAPVPPLRPAPEPVPAPVPLEPGDYVPPPPETAAVGDNAAGLPPELDGLPPEVVAALASIPPGSPDSFGVVPASDSTVVSGDDAAPPSSWLRLSVDRDGDRFYALWQIDEGDRARAKGDGGETLALRLYDVTGRPSAAPLPPAVAEQLCRDDYAQDWYLPIPQWDRIYVAEVGYLSAAGEWGAIAQSSEVAAITPS